MIAEWVRLARMSSPPVVAIDELGAGKERRVGDKATARAQAEALMDAACQRWLAMRDSGRAPLLDQIKTAADIIAARNEVLIAFHGQFSSEG